MLKTLIIADDSTGANASAILLNDLGFESLSIIDYANIFNHETFDCVAISTDSRAVEEVVAYDRVETVLKHYKDKDVLVLNKRLDSTLRGNLGSELNAFKDYYPDRKIAIVPAFPNSKRYCRKGLVYVGETLLENTDVAKDPKMPLFSSNARSLFLKQFKGRIANLYLEDLNLENDVLIDKINDLYKDNDALVFDAITNEDIKKIANVLIKTNYRYITADPGPFTLYYTKAYINQNNFLNKFYFMVGSVTDTTFKQLEKAYNDETFAYINIDAKLLLDQDKSNYEINRALDLALNSEKEFVILSTTNPLDRKVLNLYNIAIERKSNVDEISKIINNNLAKLLNKLLEKHKNTKGIFSSGGDVTLSFLTLAGAKGIKLEQEVMPLCVYGKLVEGKYHGLNIITKGGMIGNDDALIQIKTFFEGVK